MVDFGTFERRPKVRFLRRVKLVDGPAFRQGAHVDLDEVLLLVTIWGFVQIGLTDNKTAQH